MAGAILVVESPAAFEKWIATKSVGAPVNLE